MKLKSVLLASAAVLFAGSAVAADLTNPFYLPGKGQMTSDTKIEYFREKDGNGHYDNYFASEELAYGLTDNLAIVGTLGNYFDHEGDFNNSHNFDYEIGAKYNMEHGRIKAQVAASYYTYDPKSFEGHHGTDERWQKYLNGQIKLGYDMGNGLTPYASYALSSQIDNGDRELGQSAFAGVHKFGGNWAVDGGIRYDYNTDGKNNNLVYVQAAADNNWVAGYGNGKFGPDDNITRAQVVTILNRVLERTPLSEDTFKGFKYNNWTDNQNPEAWYYLDMIEAGTGHTCDHDETTGVEIWTGVID